VVAIAGLNLSIALSRQYFSVQGSGVIAGGPLDSIDVGSDTTYKSVHRPASVWVSDTSERFVADRLLAALGVRAEPRYVLASGPTAITSSGGPGR
jgi:hypothetical protein